MARIDDWYKKVKEMGEADIPIEIDGQVITPTEYMRRKGRI